MVHILFYWCYFIFDVKLQDILSLFTMFPFPFQLENYFQRMRNPGKKVCVIQGPVVQNFVSLASSLRPQLVK